MPYFHVDDKLHDQRETRAAGLEAMGLHELAGSWSADMLTDGFVPESVAVRWAPRRLKVLAAALVTAGYWRRDAVDEESGWSFVDWAESGQPTRAGMEEAKRIKAEAGRRGGKQSATARRARAQAGATADGEAPATADAQAEAQAKSNLYPNPNPTAPSGAAAPSLGQRVKMLADGYCQAVPLSNHPAVAGVARKALQADYRDDMVAAALGRLASDGRSVTTETLRVELDGLPASRNGANGRVAAGLALAQRLAQES